MSDGEWTFFAPFVIEAGRLRGRPPRDHRRTLDAIFWIARTGAPWRELPEELGTWNSVHRQYRRWTTSGLWDLMLEALADGGGSDAIQMVDSTSIRAHYRAAGARGGTQNQAFDRSGGGFTTRIHARSNAEGLPIALILSPGEAHDSTAFDALMAERDADPKVMRADKGYDSDDIRGELRARGADPEIPTKRNRKVQYTVNHALYAMRNKIERYFNRLKESRCIATRYNHTGESVLGFVKLAAIKIWIRFVHAA